MRILIAHNHYREHGGEDSVVKTECELLKHYNEEVYLYERGNAEFNEFSFMEKIEFLLALGWSRKTYREIRKVIKEFRPDVVHFHNIFFMLTPSVYSACRDEKVPIIHSLHNFRLLCSNGLFFRNNAVCEECTKHSLWRGVVHRCYLNSRIVTALVVKMLQKHWDRKTWLNMVDRYITATEFSRKKYISAGISPKKIIVKPHFVDVALSQNGHDKGYALYVGRLSEEKGIRSLLEAWESIKNIPLKIAGDGPLAGELKSYAQRKNLTNVKFLGYISNPQYVEYMKNAKFIVIPSICYENFPRIVAEAFAYGVPVLASRIGSIVEIIQEGETGLLFNPGDSNDIVEKVDWLQSHNEALEKMRKEARQEYEQKYTPELNYSLLKSIYNEAIESRQGDVNR